MVVRGTKHNMDITQIKSSLSTLIADYLECQECRVIDRELERTRSGYKCPVCGNISKGGKLYFHLNIHILIDLIQESYHSITSKQKTEKLYEGEGPHDISVVIFFCTLREALLDNLIINLMRAQNLSVGVSERLLSDNKFHIQKQDKLFKSLTGVKWNEAIDYLNENGNLDYKEIDKFIVSVVIARNSFIHEGFKWSIDRELSTNCIKNLQGLINIYAEMHNNYVHPLYKQSL